jgi:hypothetical protein
VRKGKPRPAIGKRRARRLKAAVAVAEAIHGAPTFTGDSVDYLRAIMRGELAPDPARMAAAMALAKFEHPTLAAQAVSINGPGRTLEDLVMASHEQRLERAAALIDKAQLITAEPGKLVTIDAEPSTPAIEADTRDAEMRESIRRTEAENAAIRAEIPREEDAAHNRAERERLCGVDYLPKR